MFFIDDDDTLKVEAASNASDLCDYSLIIDDETMFRASSLTLSKRRAEAEKSMSQKALNSVAQKCETCEEEAYFSCDEGESKKRTRGEKISAKGTCKQEASTANVGFFKRISSCFSRTSAPVEKSVSRADSNEFIVSEESEDEILRRELCEIPSDKRLRRAFVRGSLHYHQLEMKFDNMTEEEFATDCRRSNTNRFKNLDLQLASIKRREKEIEEARARETMQGYADIDGIDYEGIKAPKDVEICSQEREESPERTYQTLNMINLSNVDAFAEAKQNAVPGEEDEEESVLGSVEGAIKGINFRKHSRNAMSEAAYQDGKMRSALDVCPTALAETIKHPRLVPVIDDEMTFSELGGDDYVKQVMEECRSQRSGSSCPSITESSKSMNRTAYSTGSSVSFSDRDYGGDDFVMDTLHKHFMVRNSNMNSSNLSIKSGACASGWSKAGSNKSLNIMELANAMHRRSGSHQNPVEFAGKGASGNVASGSKNATKRRGKKLTIWEFLKEKEDDASSAGDASEIMATWSSIIDEINGGQPLTTSQQGMKKSDTNIVASNAMTNRVHESRGKFAMRTRHSMPALSTHHVSSLPSMTPRLSLPALTVSQGRAMRVDTGYKNHGSNIYPTEKDIVQPALTNPPKGAGYRSGEIGVSVQNRSSLLSYSAGSEQSAQATISTSDSEITLVPQTCSDQEGTRHSATDTSQEGDMNWWMTEGAKRPLPYSDDTKYSCSEIAQMVRDLCKYGSCNSKRSAAEKTHQHEDNSVLATQDTKRQISSTAVHTETGGDDATPPLDAEAAYLKAIGTIPTIIITPPTQTLQEKSTFSDEQQTESDESILTDRSSEYVLIYPAVTMPLPSFPPVESEYNMPCGECAEYNSRRIPRRPEIASSVSLSELDEHPTLPPIHPFASLLNVKLTTKKSHSKLAERFLKPPQRNLHLYSSVPELGVPAMPIDPFFSVNDLSQSPVAMAHTLVTKDRGVRSQSVHATRSLTFMRLSGVPIRPFSSSDTLKSQCSITKVDLLGKSKKEQSEFYFAFPEGETIDHNGWELASADRKNGEVHLILRPKPTRKGRYQDQERTIPESEQSKMSFGKEPAVISACELLSGNYAEQDTSQSNYSLDYLESARKYRRLVAARKYRFENDSLQRKLDGKFNLPGRGLDPNHSSDYLVSARNSVQSLIGSDASTVKYAETEKDHQTERDCHTENDHLTEKDSHTEKDPCQTDKDCQTSSRIELLTGKMKQECDTLLQNSSPKLIEDVYSLMIPTDSESSVSEATDVYALMVPSDDSSLKESLLSRDSSEPVNPYSLMAKDTDSSISSLSDSVQLKNFFDHRRCVVEDPMPHAPERRPETGVRSSRSTEASPLSSTSIRNPYAQYGNEAAALASFDEINPSTGTFVDAGSMPESHSENSLAIKGETASSQSATMVKYRSGTSLAMESGGESSSTCSGTASSRQSVSSMKLDSSSHLPEPRHRGSEDKRKPPKPSQLHHATRAPKSCSEHSGNTAVPGKSTMCAVASLSSVKSSQGKRTSRTAAVRLAEKTTKPNPLPMIDSRDAVKKAYKQVSKRTSLSEKQRTRSPSSAIIAHKKTSSHRTSEKKVSQRSSEKKALQRNPERKSEKALEKRVPEKDASYLPPTEGEDAEAPSLSEFGDDVSAKKEHCGKVISPGTEVIPPGAPPGTEVLPLISEPKDRVNDKEIPQKREVRKGQSKERNCSSRGNKNVASQRENKMTESPDMTKFRLHSKKEPADETCQEHLAKRGASNARKDPDEASCRRSKHAASNPPPAMKRVPPKKELRTVPSGHSDISLLREQSEDSAIGYENVDTKALKSTSAPSLPSSNGSCEMVPLDTSRCSIKHTDAAIKAEELKRGIEARMATFSPSSPGTLNKRFSLFAVESPLQCHPPPPTPVSSDAGVEAMAFPMPATNPSKSEGQAEYSTIDPVYQKYVKVSPIVNF